MKSVAIELEPSDVPGAREGEARVRAREKFNSFVELTKPRITFLIVLTCAAGFMLGARGGFDFLLLANTLAGVALLSSGIAALNQYMERHLDARMRRTAARPLPTGKLSPMQAFLFGTALDRKSTRLNSSHANISYAVFCLKKKKKNKQTDNDHA